MNRKQLAHTICQIYYYGVWVRVRQASKSFIAWVLTQLAEAGIKSNGRFFNIEKADDKNTECLLEVEEASVKSNIGATVDEEMAQMPKLQDGDLFIQQHHHSHQMPSSLWQQHKLQSCPTLVHAQELDTNISINGIHIQKSVHLQTCHLDLSSCLPWWWYYYNILYRVAINICVSYFHKTHFESDCSVSK